MTAYLIRRLLFMVPTLLGIMFVAFVVIQFAPGGPVERVIAQLSGADTGASSRVSGSPGGDLGARGQIQGGAGAEAATSKYRGAQGLDPDFIKSLEKQFGFDKPAYERFLLMLWNYSRFDFGKSYFRDTTVLQLIKEKLPVSISLGLWLTLLTYLISIPLGVRKAVKDGSHFDVWTSGAIIIGYAIPGFLVGILLIILFAGGSFLNIFPLRGLTSDKILPKLLLFRAEPEALPTRPGFEGFRKLTRFSILNDSARISTNCFSFTEKRLESARSRSK